MQAVILSTQKMSFNSWITILVENSADVNFLCAVFGRHWWVVTLLFCRYMLTQEGQEAARECLMRSGLVNPAENLANAEVYPDQGAHSTPDIDFTPPEKEVTSTSTGLSRRRKSTSTGLSRHRKSMDVPPESLERVYSNYFLNCYLYCEVK